MYSMLSRTYQVLLYHAGIPVCYYYYDMYQYICTEVLYVCHCITPGIIINIMGKCQNRYYILKRSKKRTPRAVLLAHEKS